MWQGLFHAAIAQSGVAVAPWALAQRARARAFDLGRELGIDTNNTAELLGMHYCYTYNAQQKHTSKAGRSPHTLQECRALCTFFL